MIVMSDLGDLEQRALAELQNCTDESSLRAWYARYVEGEVKQLLKQIGSIPKEQRPAYGQEVNRIKTVLQAAHDQKKNALADQALERNLQSDALDVTLPGRPVPRGRLHIATQVMRQICAIFADLGFQVYRSREVEDDLTNFELLNMPPEHPARDLWDTFHTTTPGVLLRTHTSPGQIHVMREYCPKPIRVILPGMVYRFEQVTMRSEMMFHQVEGLAVGEGITMADLKGTIEAFAHRMFGQDRQIRVRSSYFPFTEPSIEVDVSWPVVDEESDRLTKGTGWLEIMGAGMVHPVVLRNGGYDPAKFTGFAFGMGPQRMTMVRHAINDIRLFWANDVRFLRQF
jgi:phenylalanyl-tRNA synthetase alpha chain